MKERMNDERAIYAAYAADAAMRIKILEYGIKLLKQGE